MGRVESMPATLAQLVDMAVDMGRQVQRARQHVHQDTTALLEVSSHILLLPPPSPRHAGLGSQPVSTLSAAVKTRKLLVHPLFSSQHLKAVSDQRCPLD